MTPFERIYTAITNAAPQMAAKNTHAIHEWINTGYDVDKDIMPAIEEVIKRGVKSIHAFGFFSQAIQRHHEMRIKNRIEIPISKEELDLAKAKRIKWHKQRQTQSTNIGPQEYAWLANYEKQHGEVQI